jgi:hypothetical protein
MPRIKWDQDGERYYESGCDQGVLYPKTGANGAYATGVAWNGLTAVNESPSGGEATAFYADNIKYANILSNEEFGFTIEAYTYPDEFMQCDGSASVVDGVYLTQQKRREFGFTYRTLIGNDEDGLDKGYQIHVVYNALAKPSSKNHSTVNESPELITFSWECTTTPVKLENYKPTAHVIFDSTKLAAEKMTLIENTLYGTDGEGQATGTAPSLPSLADLIDLID